MFNLFFFKFYSSFHAFEVICTTLSPVLTVMIPIKVCWVSISILKFQSFSTGSLTNETSDVIINNINGNDTLLSLYSLHIHPMKYDSCYLF